jgi:predicted secreted protein
MQPLEELQQILNEPSKSVEELERSVDSQFESIKKLQKKIDRVISSSDMEALAQLTSALLAQTQTFQILFNVWQEVRQLGTQVDLIEKVRQNLEERVTLLEKNPPVRTRVR